MTIASRFSPTCPLLPLSLIRTGPQSRVSSSGTFSLGLGRLGLHIVVVMWMAGGLLGLLPTSAVAQEPASQGLLELFESALTKVIEQAETSVVSIARDRVVARRGVLLDEFQPDPANPLNRFGFPPERASVADPNYIPNEFGAGIIIHSDGLILTNYHLVRGGPVLGQPKQGDQQLYVRLSDKRGYPARIFAADPRSDLALLKIEASQLKPMTLPANPNFKKGQIVVSMGNPYAMARDGQASASWGMISNISRQAAFEGDLRDLEATKKETIHHLGTLLHIDTRLNLGTSGGPVLNLKGELVGMTTSLAAVVGYEKSAGFAIPLDAPTLRVIETLRRGEEVEYGFLGISPQDLEPEESKIIFERAGQYGAARVMTVVANSPADVAGIRPNDLVLHVNGKPVLSRTDLMRDVGLMAPGTKTRLKVWRPAVNPPEVALEVTVGKWPVRDDEGIVAPKRRYDPWRGLVVDYPTARYRFWPQREQMRDVPSAVLITETLPNSPAKTADLQAGEFIAQVNRVPVQTPQHFFDVVRKLKGDVTLTLSTGRQVVLKGP